MCEDRKVLNKSHQQGELRLIACSADNIKNLVNGFTLAYSRLIVTVVL